MSHAIDLRQKRNPVSFAEVAHYLVQAVEVLVIRETKIGDLASPSFKNRYNLY